jgi:hypothetical protein
LKDNSALQPRARSFPDRRLLPITSPRRFAFSISALARSPPVACTLAMLAGEAAETLLQGERVRHWVQR